MTRRHVAIVVPGWPVSSDEPGLAAVVDLVKRVAAVHDVTVVALRHPQPSRRYTFAGVDVSALGAGGGRRPFARLDVLGRGVAAVVALHRRRPLDLIHALWLDEPGAVAVIAGAIVRRPTIASLMGGELTGLADIGYGAALGRGGRVTARLTLRFAHQLTSGSGQGRAEIIARRPSARVAVAPLGVDTTLFRPAESPPSPTVLFVGSLTPVKDPALALRAFANLSGARPAARFVAAGDGPLRGELVKLAAQLGVTDRVEFRGQLPRSQMADLYRSAAVLCVSSRHEGQSVAAIEAAAAGLPVVGTRVGALPDLEPGSVTVPVNDEQALAAALARVLDDEALARRMRAAVREVAVARYDIRSTSAAVLDLYEMVLADR